MTKTSWVELYVSDFEQSVTWFESVLGFRVMAREATEYAELSRGETTIQLAADDAAYWEAERPHLLPPGQRGSGVEIVLVVDNVEEVYHRAQQASDEGRYDDFYEGEEYYEEEEGLEEFGRNAVPHATFPQTLPGVACTLRAA